MDTIQKRFVTQFKEQSDTLLLQLQQGLVRFDRDPRNPELLAEIFRYAHTLKGNANMMGFRAIGNIMHEVESVLDALRKHEIQYDIHTSGAISEGLFEATDMVQSLVEGVGRGEEADVESAGLIQRLQKISGQSAPTDGETTNGNEAIFRDESLLPLIETIPPPILAVFQQKQLTKFKEIADSQLLQLMQSLTRLERDPSNAELLKEIFRLAHTLKGDANIMGFQEIGRVAHEMENILMAIRDGELNYTADTMGVIAEVLFEAVDTIQTMVLNIGVAGRLAVKTGPLLLRLKNIINVNQSDDDNKPSIGVVTPPASRSPSNPNDPSFEPALASNRNQTAPVSNLFDDVIKVSVEKLDSLMNISSELMLDKMQTESTLRNLRTLQDLLRQRQRISQPVRTLLTTTDRDPSEVITIVDLRHNLQQIQQFDLQIEALIKATFREYEEHSSHLTATIDELESSVLEMRMLPLQTLFEDLPRKVRELVRQASDPRARLVIKANIEMSGGEIELDKKVLEEIVAPLDHIIRNSFAHGFQPEPSQQRLANGKPETATIRVNATSESGFVIIKVSDDGVGIDPDLIRQQAVEKGILTQAKAHAMSEEDILNIIFESRVSTRRIIDELAGRGVGMDVVKNNVERLNGHVAVSSQRGQGTTITLRVPLTFAISRALMVRLDNQIFAIPAPAIQTMRYLTADDILSREGRDIILHDNTIVPLVRLLDILGRNKNVAHPLFRYLQIESGKMALTALTPRGTTPIMSAQSNGGSNNNGHSMPAFTGLVLADPLAQAQIQKMKVANEAHALRQLTYERIPAVVVGTGDRRVCFIVDELVDETEIVLKSLNPVLATAEYVSGATIMGDGSVVLILDVPSLINAAKNGSKTLPRRSGRDNSPRKRILVVDDSITTRELEKSILEAQGYEIDLADDGTFAIERLRANNRYDLVICDVEMPRMDGFELTKIIKTDPILRSLPVIIVSSLNSEANKRRGIEAGAQAYITKGDFNQNNLLDTIEYLTS